MEKPLYRHPVRNLHALGLAEEDADVNAFRKGSEPALIWAADYGTPVVVKALLARGAKVSARNGNGFSALNVAVMNGREQNVRLLLAAGADPNGLDGDGYAALHMVRDVRIARRLLERGANVNARSKDDCWTPLFGAVLNGSPELVAFLLAQGANLHARNADGETALLYHMGLLNDHSHAADLAITRILLQAGAQVNALDNEGKSPLSKAVSRLRYDANSADTMRLLIEAGAIAADATGARLLAWTKQNGYDEATRLLIEAGARE
jgi:ankyrin repeat protein